MTKHQQLLTACTRYNAQFINHEPGGNLGGVAIGKESPVADSTLLWSKVVGQNLYRYSIFVLVRRAKRRAKELGHSVHCLRHLIET